MIGFLFIYWFLNSGIQTFREPYAAAFRHCSKTYTSISADVTRILKALHGFQDDPHLSKVLRLPGKSDAKSYKMLHLLCKIISKPEDLMLQNATPLPWPPNISDEHVSCTAPATRNPSLQILLKCLTPAIVFENSKTLTFCSLLAGGESLAPATQNDASTSKSGTNMWCFVHSDFELCFAPQRRTLFEHLKCSEVLTSKCASRHKGVHFFDIATSKSAPNVKCFQFFHLQMCFAPQRHVLFGHRNF